MQTITKLLAAGLLTWLALLALLVAMRILRGDIPAAGVLVHAKTNGSSDVAPERVVAMAVFPLVILMYVMSALGSDLTIVAGRPTMPDLPDSLLVLLTGANGLYLAGKMARPS